MGEHTHTVHGPTKITEATAAANRAFMELPLSLSNTRTDFRHTGPEFGSPAVSRARPARPLLQRCKTVVKPDGRPPVRGCDPMAGGLFSREARLDHLTMRKGIYDAQLIGGPRRTRRYLQAVSPRETC